MNIKNNTNFNKISIIDYGVGNIGSISNIIKKLGGLSEVLADPDELTNSKKIILPGVGSYDVGMRALNSSGFSKSILKAVENGATILGICLGMQLLFEYSEEGHEKGLGLIEGQVKKFKSGDIKIKVPHMGWNIVTPTIDSPLFKSSDEELRYYHVHSYHVICDEKYITAVTNYGYQFPSAVQSSNIYGVQFHPEKSHRFGFQLMTRFISL
jgi:imidazole glycerol-phosphate synthase subunit HisH